MSGLSGLRTPLLPGASAKDAAAALEPSPALLCTFAVALVVCGVGGSSLPRAVMYAARGDAWFKEQAWILFAMHLGGGLVAAGAAWALAPSVRASLAGVTGRAAGVEPRWDTLKYFLTQLVAFAHFSGFCWDYAWYAAVWNFKEYFLMQAYVFVSGYLSTPEPNRRRLQAIWRSLAGAYVVNQAVLMLWYFIGYEYNYNLFLLAQGPGKGFNLFWEFWDPQGALWYLSNLMMWRAAAPLWMELKRPLLASLLVVVCINYMPSEDYDDRLDFLKISSGVAFFPYYVLGIVCRRHSAKLHAALEWRATRPAALCALASCLALNFMNYGLQWSVFDFYAQCGGLCDDDNRYWFTQNEANWKASFRETYDGRALLWAWYDVVGGLPSHLAVLFGTLAAFSVRKEPVPYVTRLGANSITNYIMHWYVLLALTYTGFWQTSRGDGFLSMDYGPWKLIAAVVLTVAQAQFWMSNAVSRLVRPIFIAPDMSALLVDPRDDLPTVIPAMPERV